MLTFGDQGDIGVKRRSDALLKSLWKDKELKTHMPKEMQTQYKIYTKKIKQATDRIKSLKFSTEAGALGELQELLKRKKELKLIFVSAVVRCILCTEFGIQIAVPSHLVLKDEINKDQPLM